MQACLICLEVCLLRHRIDYLLHYLIQKHGMRATHLVMPACMMRLIILPHILNSFNVRTEALRLLKQPVSKLHYLLALPNLPVHRGRAFMPSNIMKSAMAAVLLKCFMHCRMRTLQSRDQIGNMPTILVLSACMRLL